MNNEKRFTKKELGVIARGYVRMSILYHLSLFRTMIKINKESGDAMLISTSILDMLELLSNLSDSAYKEFLSFYSKDLNDVRTYYLEHKES